MATPATVSAVRVVEIPMATGQSMLVLGSVPRERLEPLASELGARRGYAVRENQALEVLAGLGVERIDVTMRESASARHRLMSLSDSLAEVGACPEVEKAESWLRELLRSASSSELAGILTSTRLPVIQAVCHSLLDQLDNRRGSVAAEFASLVIKPLEVILFTPEG